MRPTAAIAWEDYSADTEWYQLHTIRPNEWFSVSKPRHFSAAVDCIGGGEDIVKYGYAGRPLPRSSDLMAFADEIASLPASAETFDEWVERLAQDLVQFDD